MSSGLFLLVEMYGPCFEWWLEWNVGKNIRNAIKSYLFLDEYFLYNVLFLVLMNALEEELYVSFPKFI